MLYSHGSVHQLITDATSAGSVVIVVLTIEALLPESVSELHKGGMIVATWGTDVGDITGKRHVIVILTSPLLGKVVRIPLILLIPVNNVGQSAPLPVNVHDTARLVTPVANCDKNCVPFQESGPSFLIYTT